MPEDQILELAEMADDLWRHRFDALESRCRDVGAMTRARTDHLQAVKDRLAVAERQFAPWRTEYNGCHEIEVDGSVTTLVMARNGKRQRVPTNEKGALRAAEELQSIKREHAIAVAQRDIGSAALQPLLAVAQACRRELLRREMISPSDVFIYIKE